MFCKPKAFILILLLTLINFNTQAQSTEDEKTIQTVIHLLSYISLDYSEAVEDGVIIDDFEYNEQIEFSNQVLDLVQTRDFLQEHEKEVLSKIQNLVTSIGKKLPEFVISEIADDIKNQIIIITGAKTAPLIWPNNDNGKQLYKFLCQDCHGQNGDGQGKLAATSDPAPSNFLDHEFMARFSAYQAFNSIKLGVPGTSMRPYSELSEEEIWDLAFYVKSLRFGKNAIDSVELQAIFNDLYSQINLAEVSNLTDHELLDTLSQFHDNPDKALTALRTTMPDASNLTVSLIVARQELNSALENYKSGNKTLARTHALNAYLEGIEPVETRLRSIDSKFVLEIERQMLKVRQTIERDLGVEQLNIEVNHALKMIDDADQKLKGQTLNFWLTFILAASIMLREGLEAFLILAVVLALIRSTGARKALPWLHGGWIAAVILGFIGWYLSDYILQMSGKSREVMEGFVSLFAVVVLIWAGFWLHDKSHAQQWTKFIKEKIGGYLEKDKMFGLAFFSFMVVFREAFEVILFLQAISLEAQPGHESAVGLGVFSATIFIAIFAYVFLKYSKMIPVRQLFKFSSWVIVLLAIILLGKGIRSLQESGMVPVTTLPEFLHADILGIYPTLQSIGAQILLIIIVVVSYYLNQRKINNATAQ